MRLSTMLSDKSNNIVQIESFIDWDKYTTDMKERKVKIKDGDFIEIQIGRIVLPFYSTICNDTVSFISPKRLNCLILSNTMISIDCELRCMDYDEENPKCKNCDHCVQAWYLVGLDNLSASSPTVELIKKNFKFPENIKLPIEMEDKYSVLLAKADIAYNERLGVGSVIYLREVFELITRDVGEKKGISIKKPNGRLKPFDQVINAVDKECRIVPPEYSESRYELFRILSNIAHGNYDDDTEDIALKKYESLRRLVVGVIENVKKSEEESKNKIEFEKALNSIRFSGSGESDD